MPFLLFPHICYSTVLLLHFSTHISTFNMNDIDFYLLSFLQYSITHNYTHTLLFCADKFAYLYYCALFFPLVAPLCCAQYVIVRFIQFLHKKHSEGESLARTDRASGMFRPQQLLMHDIITHFNSFLLFPTTRIPEKFHFLCVSRNPAQKSLWILTLFTAF